MYKRQVLCAAGAAPSGARISADAADRAGVPRARADGPGHAVRCADAVSYTHLLNVPSFPVQTSRADIDTNLTIYLARFRKFL